MGVGMSATVRVGMSATVRVGMGTTVRVGMSATVRVGMGTTVRVGVSTVGVWILVMVWFMVVTFMCEFFSYFSMFLL